jgi:hypothetical protein
MERRQGQRHAEGERRPASEGHGADHHPDRDESISHVPRGGQLSVIAGGAATVVNRVTAPFPATTTGNAEFKGNVDLPSPCFAPIVFVTTGAGDPPAWFSITGA